jgi:hypothetical protein
MGGVPPFAGIPGGNGLIAMHRAHISPPFVWVVRPGPPPAFPLPPGAAPPRARQRGKAMRRSGGSGWSMRRQRRHWARGQESGQEGGQESDRAC